MTPIALLFAVTISIAAFSASAQTQKTLGPCSPAIAKVEGNVTLNCNIPGQTISIPLFKGDLNDPKKYVSGDHEMGRIVIDKLNNLAKENLNRLVYLNIEFAIINYKDVGHCGIGDKRDMCLLFHDPKWTGIIVLLFDAQKFLNKQCRGECMPCSHGFCMVRGYFVPKLAQIGGQGYYAIQLQQLDTTSVLMNPKFALPE